MGLKRCKQCLVSENCPDTTINSQKVCNFCEEVAKGVLPKTEHLMSEKEKDQYRQKLDQILKTTRGKGNYDCMVGFSGGKDSVYLLHKLKTEYPNLRILAATVDMSLLKDQATENIRYSLNKLNIDHVFVKPRIDFYKKFFKYLFEHRVELGYKGGVYDSVRVTEETSGLCVQCHELVSDIMMNYCMELNIPLHITGLSPMQPLYEFFDRDPKLIATEDRTPSFMYKAPFTEQDRIYFWNPKSYPAGSEFPQMLFPYHVWEYNADLFRKTIVEEGYIESYKKTSPANTNCELNLLMAYIDYQIDGYFDMLPYLGILVRHNFMKKEEWGKIIPLLENVLLKFRHPKLKMIEKHLGINADEVIAKYKNQKTNLSRKAQTIKA